MDDEARVENESVEEQMARLGLSVVYERPRRGRSKRHGQAIA
jgi:hypothetical protein